MRDITVLVLLLVPLGTAAADAPGPPQNLTLINRTCHSITFQWSPPGDTGGLDVTGYDILHSGTPVANITGTVYTLEGLTPDTVHIISVRTRNTNGLSMMAGTLTNATTRRDSVQGKVTTMNTGSSNSLFLMSHSKAQETYRCLLSEERLESVSVNVTRGQSGRVTVESDTAYNITCLGYDNQGRDLCREQNMSIITPPSKVEDVMFGNNVVENGRIHQEVKWNAPVLRYNAKPQYLVRYANDSDRVLSNSKFEFSSDPNTTLQLTFGTLNITYYVVVAVRQTEKQGSGDHSDIVSIAYTTPGPPQNLRHVNKICHSITFQWSPPDDIGRLDVTGYDIVHNGTPVANITGTVYTLEGLTPDTVHTISVRTRNAIGPSVLWRTLTTAIEGRLQQQVTAASVSSRNLTLRHEAQVTYRCLLSAQGLKPVSVNVTSGETVTVTVLPDTMYTVGCVGYGEQGQDLCVEGNTTITTRPPKVKNVIFGRTKVVHNVIWQDISWSTVQLQNDVTKFLIKSDSSPKMATALPIAQSNTASYTLKLNVPTSNTTFTVWVAATRNRALRDHGDFSDPQSITYTTPGPPKDLTLVNRTCHSITFQWSPPDDTGRLNVTGYNIRHNGTPVATITGTVYTLEGLIPDTVHTISMRTRNAIGPSVLEKTLTNETTQRHSDAVQGKVTADSVSSHNLTLNHSEAQTTYRCLLNAEEVESVSVNVTSRGTVTITHPDTAYNVTCLGYDNQGGDLCREQNMSIITRPPKVEGVMFGNNIVKNGRIHQEIKWNTAVLRYNKFPKYIIRYAESRRDRSEQSSVPNTTLQLTFSTSNITYYIRVAVKSARDQKRGDFSNPVSITYTTPGPPQDLTLVNRTCHSITFQWSPPDDTGRLDVTGYNILHNGRPVATITGTVYTLEGLTPDTVHTISVRTRNAIGSSVLGRKLTRATEQRDKPLMVTAETISSRSIGIGIFPPKPQTGRLHYKCNLTTEGSDSVQMLSLNDTRNNSPYIAVKDLSPYTNYTATCWVLRDGMDQCYTGSNTTLTYTDKPSASPQEVSIGSTSSHSFTMTWAPPPKVKQNGEIVSYEVEYRDEGSNSKVVNTTRGMRYTAEDLTTDRVYQFSVAATTVNGTGPFSKLINVTTIPTVTNLTVINTTTNSATIAWDQPPHNYRVFLHGEATDNITQSRVIQRVNVTGQTTHIVEGLDSFRKYSISIYLKSDLGQGSNATVTLQTQGRAPDGSPTYLSATPRSRSVTLQWSPPPVLSRNGILTHYVVGLANETWNTTQSHSIKGEQRKRREADSERVGEETQSLTVEHLRPFTNYTWEVAAVSGFGAGPSSRRRFEMMQDVPAQVENIIVNPGNKTVTWEPPVERNGIIVSYRVQYWELERKDKIVNTTAVELVFSYSIFSAGVPHKVQVQAATVAGLGESRVVEEVLFSEERAPSAAVSDITVTRVNDTAVRVTWTALTLNEARGFPSYVVNITKDSEQVSSQRTPSTSVVVGGLMPHTEYSVTVQALTAGGRKEGPISEPMTIEALPEPTDGSSSPLTWILVVLIVVLIVGVVIFTVIVVVICRRYRSKNKTRPVGLWKDIPMKEKGVLQEGIHAPLDLGPITDPEEWIQRKEAVLKENFCEHVQKLHQDKNAPFGKEYQSITKTPEGASDSAYKANMMKNRYANIFPYDHSRVVLSERDANGSDYINAAYIDAYNWTNGYIATQGPTGDTLDDFWQMVWEHHAPVIVMLTKLIEKNKRKCERYWSTALNEPFKPGRDLSVTILRCDTHPEFELRTIKVEKLTSKEDPLEVKHFLYTAWPDHGVPQYSVSIHRFIRKHVRPVHNDSSAPLIVHCSAGAGRTGTYMAIDTMMYQLEDRQDVNIFEYVERMRTRRTQMVQNASQYIYIHDAINDYINCKNTTIVAHELRPRIEEMRQIDSTTGSSGFVTQFSLLAEVSIKQCDADYAFAEEEDIMSKNRYRGLCPFSDKHISKEDGSYVNASEVSGYCGQRNFIAAQTPMKNTEGDVWEMIWMEKCAAVVVLCDFMEGKDEMCSKFWPLKMSEPKTFGSIKVCLDDKAEQASCNEYHLTVSFTDHPDPLNVVVFHYLQWPRHGRPSIPPYLQLMGEVKRSQHNAKGRTLVMCDDGMSRTGVFITTMAEVERVKVQGEVDIFQTVKAARSERPHMVSTPVDYEVCHDVLVSYLESFDTYANFK